MKELLQKPVQKTKGLVFTQALFII